MGLRKTTIGKFPWDHKCKICGQYTLEGEDIYIVYPPREEKIVTWGIVHKNELDAISEGLEDDAKIEKLRGIKQPRFKGFTDEQKKNAEIFKDVCYKRGFNKPTMSKRTLKIGKRGTSFKVTYDMITQSVSYDYRARKGLFDGLFFTELISTIASEFQVAIGNKPSEIITAASIIQKAVDETNKLMGRK